MENLIKALQILLKYGNPDYPTNCSHDIMRFDIESNIVSEEDIAALEDLKVYVDDEFESFYSTFYGSN